MDLTGERIAISVATEDLDNQSLQTGIAEMLEVAQSRGLEIPALAGAVAMEASQDTETVVESHTPLTPESLLESVDTAHKGYTDFVTQLNVRRDVEGKMPIILGTPEQLAEELEALATPENLEYINKVLESDPTLSYTVTAAPNELVSGQEVIDSNRQFGEDQPRPTDVWSSVLTEYTDEEVSGTDPSNGNTFMLSIRFSKPTLTSGNLDSQNRAIAEMKEDNPSLRPTTPLEDEVYVRTLRAEADGSLVGDGVFEATITRFPQMKPKHLDGFQYVPYACVDDFGYRRVSDSYVGYADFVAVVVG